MIIAQITDLHVPAPGTAREDGFDPAADAERAIGVLRRWQPKPDLLLLTGDLVNDGEEAEYRRLKDMLTGLPMPYYLMPGNHDRREALRSVFGPLSYDRPDATFMQYTVDAGPLRLIMLDTLEPEMIGGVLCADRLAWFEKTLAQAPDKPTLVALHHPPFVTGMWGLDRCGFEGMESFRELIGKNPQVRLIVSGHSHRNIWSCIAHAPVTTCPSTTFALALGLEPESPFRKTPEAAGFMLHVWDDDAGKDGEFVTHTVLLNTPEAI